MFVAALNFADDAGNLDRSARQLKVQALPYDKGEGEPLIAELLRAGLFIEYEVDGKLYLHIKNFDVHQKIDRPSKSRLPLYDNSLRTRVQLAECSSSPRQNNLAEGKGREGIMEGIKKGEGEKATPPPNLDLQAWEKWTAYRTEIKKPIKAVSKPAAQIALAKYGESQSAVVEQSIANGWTGLFALKTLNGSGSHRVPFKAPRSAAEILAEEEAAHVR